jgi:hypothetical protein
MNRKTFKGNRLIALAVLVVVALILANAAFALDFDKMDLGINVSSKIYNLTSLGGNLSDKQANRIMKTGFLGPMAESYGYFRVNLYYDRRHGDSDTAYSTACIITGAFTLGLGALVIPASQSHYELTASIEFFDRNKQKIAEFKAFDTIDVNLYLASDWSKREVRKTEPVYRELLAKCLRDASRHADEINAALTMPDAFYALTASERIPPGSRIAVLGVDPNVKDGVLVTRSLEAQFINSKQYQILDRTSIDTILAEKAFSRSVFINSDSALELGKMLTANFIIVGDIAGDGSTRTLIFRVLSVATGEVLAVAAQKF